MAPASVAAGPAVKSEPKDLGAEPAVKSEPAVAVEAPVAEPESEPSTEADIQTSMHVAVGAGCSVYVGAEPADAGPRTGRRRCDCADCCNGLRPRNPISPTLTDAYVMELHRESGGGGGRTDSGGSEEVV